jgi:PhnB protein
MAVKELFAYICVKNTNDAIAFYGRAFGATEKFRLTEPTGRIGHAEVDLGGTTLMLCDEFPEYGIAAPQPGQRTSVTIHIHVDNADEVIERAVAAGATLETKPSDAFYGERSGVVRDPFGHRWNIGHHIEDVSTDEMQRRYTGMFDTKCPS